MLTEKTRVFKVGLFVQSGTELLQIEGAVSDLQRGYRPTTEVADFFLKKFLGCELLEAPEITTKKLLQTTERFIREIVANQQTKARYEIAILSELSSQSAEFRPREFAQQYLDTDHRMNYLSYLEESNVPQQTVVKDLSLVRSQLKRVQMDFRSGISILGDTDTFDEYVKISRLDDGRAHVEFDDHVKEVRGKR
jgi:hypothetical protein